MLDDEFIGCRKLIECYGNNIDNVIFLTNGEKNVAELTDTIAYTIRRRLESAIWLQEVAPNCDIHYLNVQDGISIEQTQEDYGYKLFETINGENIITHLDKKVNEIVGDNIIVMPNMDKHPSHRLAATICEFLPNKRIYYSIQDILANRFDDKEGTHIFNTKILDKKYYGYYYVYSDNELKEKRKEFQTYYLSQYNSFLKTGINIQNWEGYLSEVPLRLSSEDQIYKTKAPERI